MRKLRNIIIGLLSVCLLIPMCGSQVMAASGSVTLSGGSGKVGSTVTVNGSVKCSGGKMGGVTVTLSYDHTKLMYTGGSSGTNGGSGRVIYSGFGDGNVTTLSFSMQFKVKEEGTHKISGVAEGYDFDEKPMAIKVSGATVKGTVVQKDEPETTDKDEEKPAAKSSNTKLNSLKVYPGTLAPAFSPDVRNYTVTVPDGTKEVTLSVAPQSTKATYYTTGTTGLKVGENLAKVVVTAENGTSNSYSIKVIVEEKPRITAEGKEYFVDSLKKTSIPNGYTKAKIKFGKEEFEGYKSEQTGLELLCLKQEGGRKEIYIVDGKKQTVYPFYRMPLSDVRYVVLLPIADNEKVGDYLQTSIVLEGKIFDAWEEEKDKVYLVKTINDEGEEYIYRYDFVDGTFQRYAAIEKVEMETVVEETEPTETKIVSKILPAQFIPYLDYILIGAAALVLILFIIVLSLAFNKHQRRGRKEQKERKLRKKEKKRAKRQAEKDYLESEKRREAQERQAEKERIDNERMKEREDKKAEKERLENEKIQAREDKKAEKERIKEEKKRQKKLKRKRPEDHEWAEL